MMKKSRLIKVLGSFLVSGFFLWLAVRKADLARVADTLKNVDVPLLCAVFVLSMTGLIVRSYRWKLLGERYRGTPWNCFFRATSIGLMLNMYLPFRSGDFFQAYFMSRGGRFTYSYTLSTVALERLVDLIPPVLMLIGGSLFVAMPGGIELSKVLLFFGAVSAAVVLIIWKGKDISILAGRFHWFGHSAKVQNLLNTFSESLAFIKSPQVLAGALPLTFFNWFVLNILSTWLLLRSLDIQLSYLQVLVVQGIMIIGVAIPASPGYIGTWEFFTMLALSVFNVNKSDALSFAILSHFMSFIPVTLTGITFLAYEILVKKDREELAVLRRNLS